MSITVWVGFGGVALLEKVYHLEAVFENLSPMKLHLPSLFLACISRWELVTVPYCLHGLQLSQTEAKINHFLCKVLCSWYLITKIIKLVCRLVFYQPNIGWVIWEEKTSREKMPLSTCLLACGQDCGGIL